MKRNDKRLITAAFLSPLILAAGCAFYRPGQLGSGRGIRGPLAPPSQENVSDDRWKVEAKGIKEPAGVGEALEGQGGWMPHALYLSLGRRYDYRPLLSRVKAPVLVIHGEDDIFPSGVSEEYAGLFADGRLAVIPGASHFAYDEQPEEFARRVGAFLGEAGDSDRGAEAARPQHRGKQ